MEHKLVSVIIPVYNMEAYLGETLDSVLASDYPCLEVIVMDDGSSDRSPAIAAEYAARDPRVKARKQPNAGACAARNRAIAEARGEYILPVDADDLIEPDLISRAVRTMEEDVEVRVVAPSADFFGDRTGPWRLPPFSLRLLARKNMISISALYRKRDWERAGGYCAEIIAREDWEFWISVLKDGGKVVRLPEVGLHYRVRAGSKRVTDRRLKRHVVEVLNRRHPEFFERELGGPLRYRRSWSRAVNRIVRFFRPRRVGVHPAFGALEGFVRTLPERFAREGTTIYKGRNELKEFTVEGHTVVVKSYRIPHLLNRLAYRLLRAPKAERSYRYALLLHEAGVGSPMPVGYCTTGSRLLLGRSYYACLKSECPYTYRDLAARHFDRQEDILRAIARTTATLHEHGMLHKDYSAGNILFREREEDGGIDTEVIDLNRMRFGRVDMAEGCKNFERLPATPDMLAVMAGEYAKARGYDAEECLRLMEKAHVGH